MVNRLRETEAFIKTDHPEAKTRLLLIDQASLESVRRAAAEVNLYSEPIDASPTIHSCSLPGLYSPSASIQVLINGAGIVPSQYQTTVEGIELQFGVNHLSHFLFTNLIKPSLLRSKSPRVVNISSMAHRRSDIRWDDIGFGDGATYDSMDSCELSLSY